MAANVSSAGPPRLCRCRDDDRRHWRAGRPCEAAPMPRPEQVITTALPLNTLRRLHLFQFLDSLHAEDQCSTRRR